MTQSLADLLLTVDTCTCRAYPALHRADLHDENGQIVDMEQSPSLNWAQLQHARCLRCGWRSAQSWFAEDFVRRSAQSHIADHRGRWTGECR